MATDEEIYRLCAKLFIKWGLSEDRAESIDKEPEYNALSKALSEVEPETAKDETAVKLFFMYYAGMGAGLELYQAIDGNSQAVEPELTAWELNVIHDFRKLTPEGQDFIRGTIQGYAEAQRKQACKIVKLQPRQ